MENLTPNIFISDMARTIEFYKELGFKVTMNVPDQAPFIWVNMSCGSVSFMFQTWDSLGQELPALSRSKGSGPVLYYISIKSIRAYFEMVKNKATVLKGLEKTFYGATEFVISDPDGNILTFAEHEG
ncbi:MAG: VOC family protein [Bacteroidia bacterium]